MMRTDPAKGRYRPRPDDWALAFAALAMAAVGVLGACRASNPQAERPAETVEVAPADAEPAKVVEAGHANPLVGIQAHEDEFAAVVAERVAAGGYTYLRLTTSGGAEHWLATMGKGAEPGARVQVHAYGVRNDFHSRRTGMTFDRLLFGEAKLVGRSAVPAGHRGS